MKITAITTMMLMAGAVAEGANHRPERQVTICIEGSLGSARSLFSKMFAGQTCRSVFGQADQEGTALFSGT